jgi:hypothetical protein
MMKYFVKFLLLIDLYLSYSTTLFQLHRLYSIERDGKKFLSGEGKGKVFPVILTRHHAMKTYWGMEMELHAIFDLGTRWR